MGYCKLLVAYDDSDSSRNALAQAVRGFHDGWIKVLAALPVYDGDLEFVGIRDKEALRRGPRESYLQHIREIVGDDAERVKSEIVQGEAFEQIIEAAENEHCSLIVMGRHGLHRVERMLMGSVTAKVIVHTMKDVLVVPRAAVIGWDHILLATDGSESGDAALQRALEYAAKNKSKLTAISVVDMYPEYYADAGEVVDKLEKKAASVLERAVAVASEAGVEIETHVLHGDPASEITTFGHKHGSEITFVGSRGQSGIRKIVLGSVAQKVIGLSSSPVYVVKAA